MSLKIRINKQSLSETKPAKRRLQRIESDDDDEATNTPSSSHDPSGPEPRSKKSRTSSQAASNESDDDYPAAAEDEDVDIDGDIEDTRFLPDIPPPASRSLSPVTSSSRRRLSNTAASSSKSRPKEKDAKSSKNGKSKKPKRQVVYTDSEEEFDDPDVVPTDDEDFDPEPEQVPSKKSKGVKLIVGKQGTKGKTVRKEDKAITFRDERRIPSTAPQPSVDPVRRPKPEVEEMKPQPAILDEPIPKKRKLPPIKKNKPATSGSTVPSTPATKPSLPVTSSTPVEKKDSLTPALTSNQVGARKPAGASTDLNLLDSSVYSELFRSAPGVSTPNSGLNRKQKEEDRRKELNKMRNEARAKREAEAQKAFDLQSAPEKIQRYEETLRSRHSMARYPNVLGGSFKEIFDRRRAGRVATTGPEHR